MIKLIFALISLGFVLAAFIPYLRDIFKRKTEPHAYTWLVWSITQGTAVTAMIYSGGGIGSLELAVGTFFVFFIFLLSLKYGTKNIKKVDIISLIFAVVAIIVWWQLENPFLSVLMVSIIDIFGYIPSIRKTYEEPWSETLNSWFVFIVGNLFAMLALEQYNFLTLSYLISISIANLILALTCLYRRRLIPKPGELQ